MKKFLALPIAALMLVGSAGSASALRVHSDGGEYRTGNTPRSTWWSATAVSFEQPSGEGQWLSSVHLNRKQRLAPDKAVSIILEFRDRDDKVLCRFVAKKTDGTGPQKCNFVANRPIEYVAWSVDVNNDGKSRMTRYLRP